MKTVIVKKTSWHYRLALFGGWDQTNLTICQYLTAVVKGIVLRLVAIAIVGGILYSLAHALAYISAEVLHAGFEKLWTTPIPNKALIGVLTILGGLGAIGLKFIEVIKWSASYRFEKNTLKDYLQHHSSILYALYKRIKDKACIYIKVE